MLRLLTDEQISPAVASQASQQCPGINVIAIHSWEDGEFMGAADELVLREAQKQRLTLVTFDLRTIPLLLRSWAEQGFDHSGVIIVDERTIAQNDIGGLVKALCTLWRTHRDVEWMNRVAYLQAGARA